MIEETRRLERAIRKAMEEVTLAAQRSHRIIAESQRLLRTTGKSWFDAVLAQKPR
jgi:hypothetical protein